RPGDRIPLRVLLRTPRPERAARSSHLRPPSTDAVALLGRGSPECDPSGAVRFCLSRREPFLLTVRDRADRIGRVNPTTEPPHDIRPAVEEPVVLHRRARDWSDSPEGRPGV